MTTDENLFNDFVNDIIKKADEKRAIEKRKKIYHKMLLKLQQRNKARQNRKRKLK